MNSLSKLQAALKVPKNRLNSFSKFKYRNLEDILEAIKSGRVKPADLRKHYKVSKQTMQYFESLTQ